MVTVIMTILAIQIGGISAILKRSAVAVISLHWVYLLESSVGFVKDLYVFMHEFHFSS